MRSTPGPWTWRELGGRLMLVTEHQGSRVVLSAKSPLQTRDANGILRELEADHPNARVIGAAPELLEALKEAVKVIRIFNGLGMPAATETSCWQAYQSSPEMRRINAAIAKAEGRAEGNQP